MLNECVNLKLLTYSKHAKNVNYNYVFHDFFLSLFLSLFPNCLGWLDTHGGGWGEGELGVFYFLEGSQISARMAGIVPNI